eukprot:scaffold2180_cov98-Skeletonema_marinoi.AAC.5
MSTKHNSRAKKAVKPNDSGVHAFMHTLRFFLISTPLAAASLVPGTMPNAHSSLDNFIRVSFTAAQFHLRPVLNAHYTVYGFRCTSSPVLPSIPLTAALGER